MIEKHLNDALKVAERHMNTARELRDTPTEMIYTIITNKIRKSLFEIQQNLCPVDEEAPDEGVL